MYYLLINGQKSGPFSAVEVKQYLQKGAIGFETQFWQDGMMNWSPISAARHLFENPVRTEYQEPSFQNPPIAYYQPQQNYLQPVFMSPAKSRITYILLGLFLGGLGIHNFYAGHTSRGITQLLLNLFLFWTIVVPFGIAIWVIIEIITVDMDANGYKMT